MGGVTAEALEAAIRERLQATDAVVIDISGGCGSAFEVAIASPLFEGKRLLQRHQLVNQALAEEIKLVHAFSIKKAATPEELRQQKQQA
eukprot:jgi/Chlat1/6880/Chrsp51S06551